jgi:hypothetical protein
VTPGGGSQGLNRFSYVLNNPLRLTDPSGYCVTNNRETTRNDKFDCTIDEIQQMTWDTRWWWVGELMSASGAVNWFNAW